MKFKKYFFLYIIISLLIITFGATILRFSYLQDYTVAYEIDCEPTQNSCFVGCEDDECSEVYYYSVVKRAAKNIFALCGSDITDCVGATTCYQDEKNCSITYCGSSEWDECAGGVETTLYKTETE